MTDEEHAYIEKAKSKYAAMTSERRAQIISSSYAHLGEFGCGMSFSGLGPGRGIRVNPWGRDGAGRDPLTIFEEMNVGRCVTLDGRDLWVTIAINEGGDVAAIETRVL